MKTSSYLYASMAIYLLLLAFSSLLIAESHVYALQHVKGTIACLDCPSGSDLSGIQVLVKCDNNNKLGVTYTESNGTFETQLLPESSKPSKCLAKINGGPYQMYVSSRNSMTLVYETEKTGNFDALKPLNFYSTCPSEMKCGAKHSGFGSSKTIDLPLPREWGLPPTSYYTPFFPIIGIP